MSNILIETIDLDAISETISTLIGDQYVVTTFTILAFLIFAYVYWRNATAEGFSSDMILDSFFLILLGGLIGGKIIFRPLNIDYFRYQIIQAPLILEGVLIGGAIATFWQVRRNKWDPWKIGDMIAPAVALFQAIIFLGLWIRIQTISWFLIFLGFIGLRLYIDSLKRSKNFGSSLLYFQLKRLNRNIFTGALFAVYLTGSSLIAILFLVTHINQSSWFWWVQISFYFIVLVVSYVLFARRLKLQGFNMGATLSPEFLKKMKSQLMSRLSKLKSDKEQLVEKDPFIHEAKVEGDRDIDSYGDEVSEQQQHDDVEAIKEEVEEEIEETEEAIEKIEEGTYGVSKTGKPIDKKRLQANPTADLTAEEQEKEDED